MLDETPTRLADTADTQEFLGCHAPEHHDQWRVDQGKLPKEIEGGTGIDFAFSWRPIVFRSALHRISDKESGAIEAAPCQHRIEKAPGRTDKWLTATVFLSPWRFANEHYLRTWGAISWDGMRT
jgi:hypothetical protein